MSRVKNFGKNKPHQQHSLPGSAVVLYVRASTADQVNSLDAQRKRAAEFAKAKDLTILETFIDSGVSAVQYGIRDRPQAKRMFAYIKKHGIATILVLRLDRAFRSSLDFSRTTTEGLEQGFHFRFIEPDIDYGTPMGRMFAGMEALRAEMEGELRNQRVNDAYDSLRENRIARSNNPGYGWKLGPLSGSISRSSRKPLHTLLPIPAEQAILRHIKARYDATPGHGILTATDGIWKHITVKSVLAHAVLATDAELPDGLPPFHVAAAILQNPTQSEIQNPKSKIINPTSALSTF
jgi:DNA invertase Pin-like site-specific DNA recombinase